MDYLTTLFAQADILIISLIFVLGIAAFILSTISGGGWRTGVGARSQLVNWRE